MGFLFGDAPLGPKVKEDDVTMPLRPFSTNTRKSKLGFIARPSIISKTMAAATGRLKKELAEVGKNDTSGVNAKPLDPNNLRHLKGTLTGPEGTVYEGGVFQIDIIIPKQYPFEPPKMKYITKVWHPNVSSQTGAICLVGVDILLYLSRSACFLCLAFFVVAVTILQLTRSKHYPNTGHFKRSVEPRLDH